MLLRAASLLVAVGTTLGLQLAAAPAATAAPHGAPKTTAAASPSAAPVASDDTVPAVDGGPDVFLPAASNDGPGIDPARTVFSGVAPDAVYGAKVATTAGGRWSVLPNGSVRFQPGLGHAGATAQVAYRVYDTAGQSAVAQLRVPLRPGPTARPHPRSTPQGKDVAVDVLASDDPGQKADGTAASFVRSSLKLTGITPSSGYNASYISDRSSIRIAGVGDFVVDRGLRVDFDPSPYPTFVGSTPVLGYTALTTAGTRVNGTVTIQVLRTTGGTAPVPDLPVATDDYGVTTPQVPITLPAQSNDLPGVHPLVNAKLSFLTNPLPKGSSIVNVAGEQELAVPGEGVWRTHRANGTISFQPDPDFVGQVPPIPGYLGQTSSVGYSITDSYGHSDYALLGVSLLPGAYARPDAITTRQGRSVNANVLLNDYPGRSGLIGSVGTFADPRLTTTGLPSGAAVTGSGSTLTVPGQGVYSVSPGNRTVTFVPLPTFRGTASPVTYALRVSVPVLQGDPATVDLTARLTVTVLGADPVAKPDTASTTVGHPVVVPILANDSPGSPVVPLVASSVRLRLSPALPTGSTLSGDAKKLTVAGRGVFTASGTGEVTFVPTGTATGKVPVIGYQVADVNGTTARTTLTVTVR